MRARKGAIVPDASVATPKGYCPARFFGKLRPLVRVSIATARRAPTRGQCEPEKRALCSATPSRHGAKLNYAHTLMQAYFVGGNYEKIIDDQRWILT